MKVVVYIDVFFLINSVMNFIILYCEKTILRLNSPWYRLTIGSIVGSLGAVIFIMQTQMPLLLRGICLYGIISAGIIIVSFGYGSIKNFLFKIAVFYGISFFLGGIFNFLTQQLTNWSWIFGIGKKEPLTIQRFITVIVIIVITMPLWFSFIKKRKQTHNQYYQVQLIHNKKKLNMIGFYDTGNCLRHWLTKKPVAVVESKYIEKLLTEEEKTDISLYMQAGMKEEKQVFQGKSTTRLTIIPYHSLGQNHGMLIGITLDNVIVGKGKEKKENPNTIVALYEGRISVNGEYRMILHGELIESL